MTIKEITEKTIPIAQKFGVNKVAVFGSTARGEATVDSDVDFLIERGKLRGFAYGGFCMALEEALGKSVDVVSYKQLETSFLKNYVLKDEVVIYERK